MNYNTIKYNLDINEILNISHYVGSAAIYSYEYESNVVPRIGETVSIGNRDLISLYDKWREDRKPAFVFSNIYADGYGWESQEFKVEDVKYSNNYGVYTQADIKIIPTQKTLDKWKEIGFVDRFINAFNANKEVLINEEAERKEKELKRKEKELKREEHKNTFKKILFFGLLK